MRRRSGSGIIALLVMFISCHVQAQLVWTRQSSTPVLGTGCGADYYLVVDASVLKEGGVYRMWYADTYGIVEAISTDGAHWYRNSSTPQIAGGRGPTVVHDAGGYKMYYNTGSLTSAVINLATSPDGFTWSEYPNNPVLTGGAGQWDDGSAFFPCVVYEDTVYKMWYQSYNGVTGAIGLATSANGTTWTKYPGNPLTTLGSSVGQTKVVWSGDRYDMLCTGQQGVYYAASSDGVHWTLNSTPVLRPTGGSWQRARVAAGGFIWTGEQYEQWYSAEGDVNVWQIGYATAHRDSVLVVGTHDESTRQIPRKAELREPHPNPFNPSVEVSFVIPSLSSVRIDIFDMLGRKVATVADETVTAGEYSRWWKADAFASGVYFCRLEATEVADRARTFVQTKKMMLVR